MSPFTAGKILKRIEKISHKKFVIHGSITKRSVLIPKKPLPSARVKTFHQKAVYATSVVEIAILYAVIHGDPRWKYIPKEGFCVIVPEGGYKLCEGYIHVCLRKDFKGGPLASFSKKPVVPTDVIKVHPDMLTILKETNRLIFVEKQLP